MGITGNSKTVLNNYSNMKSDNGDDDNSNHNNDNESIVIIIGII